MSSSFIFLYSFFMKIHYTEILDLAGHLNNSFDDDYIFELIEEIPKIQNQEEKKEMLTDLIQNLERQMTAGMNNRPMLRILELQKIINS